MGFEVLVGEAVLTNNLLRIAQLLEDKSKKRSAKESKPMRRSESARKAAA